MGILLKVFKNAHKFLREAASIVATILAASIAFQTRLPHFNARRSAVP